MNEKEHYRKFREDMETAGFIVTDYQGRFYYDGPAVIVDNEQFQDVIRATSLKLKWDEMGHSDVVIYPSDY